ncbi:MAG: hypothetical protein JSR46_04680, partial [Verrucomicrobia bacterium]|nr:hypothetical protein [Verrucomicrobiota bacterium]
MSEKVVLTLGSTIIGPSKLESISTALSKFIPTIYDEVAIFEIESAIRDTLQTDFPEKAKFQELHSQRIAPLLAQTKESITKSPHHISASAAAVKGKAAQAGLQAIKSLSESHSVIKNSAVSAQQVFLLPDEQVVFKHSHARAEEEERLVNDLFDLMTEQGVVGTFHIQSASRKEFGMQASQEAVNRGYSLEMLTPDLRAAIKKRLSYEDFLLMEQNKNTPPSAKSKALESDTQRLFFTPDIKKAEDKMAYQICEQHQWSYTNAQGEKKECSFKELHKRYLKNEPTTNVQRIPHKSGKTVPNNEQFERAMNIKWKAVSPELMKLEGGAAIPLGAIQAKPFISNMLLMSHLSHFERNILLGRLTADAEFNAVLTGELQLLDLHGGNLGLAPEPTAEYERFKDLKFSTSATAGSKDFNTLLREHIAGAITPDTPIAFVEEGKQVVRPLKDLPALQKALDVKWQLVIFDTDLSLSEGNRLSYQTRAGKEEHLIPIRSCLLETRWKDLPLRQEAVRRLIASDERDERVQSWIAKADAPIYKQ